MDSGSNRVEYEFTASVDGLEKGVKQVESLIKEAKSIGEDFKVDWGEGSGSVEEYSKWLENANQEYQNYVSSQEQATASSDNFVNSTNSLSSSVAQVSSEVERGQEDWSGYDNVIYGTIGSINDLEGKVLALLAAMTAVEATLSHDSLEAFASYEDAIYSMASTVGRVGGTIEEAMEGVRIATANGLISEEDAIRGINNLTNYGYSVQEATRLLQELTYVAMSHREADKSVSDQVEALTDGLMRQSSQILKNNGLLINLGDVQNQYASALGVTANELSEVEQRQAQYNAIVEMGEQSSAVASAYQETYSAATQRLANAMAQLRVAFGQVLAPFATWVANAATWVVQNKEMVIAGLRFVGVIAGAGGMAVALAKLIPLIGSAISWFSGLNVAAKGLVIGLATVAATIAVVAATSSAMTKNLANVANITMDSGDTAEDASVSFDDLGTSIGGMGGQARDVSKELENLRRNYLEDLKEIEKRHKETIEKLTKQIQDANVDYRRAIDERNAEFAVSQAKEEKKHQEKVDDIMVQIAFLQRYNNDYNKQKLANLEFALAKENALYQKQTQATKEELELQNENDRQAYEERKSQLQSELDEELRFMEKHREDLKEVRDVILLDEIDALKRRYEEQQKSYAEQAAGAGVAGGNIGGALGNSFNDKMKEKMAQYQKDLENSYAMMNQLSQTAGAEMGESFGSRFKEWSIKRVGDAVAWIIEAFIKVKKAMDETFRYISSGQALRDTANAIQNYFTKVGQGISAAYDVVKTTLKGGFASGGYTGRGGVNEVAGVVHKGEYVLPQEMVDQNNGVPKSLGNTFVINISGTFATSAAERRKVADQIVAAINQNNRARLEGSWQ